MPLRLQLTCRVATLWPALCRCTCFTALHSGRESHAARRQPDSPACAACRTASMLTEIEAALWWCWRTFSAAGASTSIGPLLEAPWTIASVTKQIECWACIGVCWRLQGKHMSHQDLAKQACTSSTQGHNPHRQRQPWSGTAKFNIPWSTCTFLRSGACAAGHAAWWHQVV